MCLMQEINSLLLPSWRKDAIREKAKTTQKQLDSYDKAAKAAVADKVVNELLKCNLDD